MVVVWRKGAVGKGGEMVCRDIPMTSKPKKACNGLNPLDDVGESTAEVVEVVREFANT